MSNIYTLAGWVSLGPYSRHKTLFLDLTFSCRTLFYDTTDQSLLHFILVTVPKYSYQLNCCNVKLVSLYLGIHKMIYQSSLILTELFQHDLINVSYLMACYLYQVMMTLHFLNDVAYDAESIQKSKLRHNC